MNKFHTLVQDTVRWSLVVIGAAIIGVLWIWASTVPAEATTGGFIPSPREGFLAPDFTLESLSGDEISLSDMRGKVIVLNLWASWCPPCRAEMPALQRVYQENKERGLEVLAVNMTAQDSLADVEAFVQEFNLTFPILLDTSGEVGNTYLMRALPTTFFIDREGVIQRVIVGGPMSEVTLQSTVEQLLEGVP
ncbi:MAG: TlpA family protein disulfide reductase [Anaerolineales bacterium]|nr:MAG: TlpA family protein disulfide reductase [Anaerolineales bacterium]